MDFEIKDGMLLQYQGNEDIVLLQYQGNKQIVTVPDGVTKIGKNAFSYNTELVEVTLPETVTEISAEAFAFCKNLMSINIPESVTSIGEKAFAGCSFLEKIRIPGHITSMSETVFAQCNIIFVYPLFEGGPEFKFHSSYADISTVMKLIHEKDLSVQMDEYPKHTLIWFLWLKNPNWQEITAYIRAHMHDMFRVCMDLCMGVEDTEIMQYVLDDGRLIAMEDIDDLIQQAIEQQYYEVQVMLTDYKHRHGGYGDTDTDIQNKFSL